VLAPLLRPLVFLLCVCNAAAADFSEADATRIGREADVPGLRALIGQRNASLLHRATGSWNFGKARELPPALEALIIEHYADTVAQRPLLALIARSLDRYERYPKYRSRKLFELLYADLKAGKDNLHYAIRVIATDLGVEPELVALLPRLDPAGANELVMFLGRRKYAPAVPALEALQARVPHERNVNQMIERVDWAYLQIGTPAAVQALLERLRTLGRIRDERAGFEVWNILLYVKDLPPGSAPGYAELAAALPAELNESAWSALIQLIAARKEKAGVPKLVRAIEQSPKPEEAVDTLLAIGDSADWRAGRDALEKSRARTPVLQKKLDDAIADPARLVAQRGQREQAQQLQRDQAALGEEKRRIAALKLSDPKRYATEMRAALDRQAGVGARGALVQEYMALAAFLRFALRQPDDAIAAYEAASRARPQDSFDIAAAGIADLQRFDKRDRRKAVEQYRRALASYRPTPASRDASLFAGFRQWIEREIDYLERGRKFNGPIGAADLQAAYYWLALGSTQESLQPFDPAALARLPASQIQLARSFPAMLELPPREMLQFFDKHDPAGYLTAAILGYAALKEPSPYVKSAAETFYRGRGIKAPFASPGDPHYASPEKTWEAFLSSANKGDAAGMLACFTPGMQAKLEPLFRRMSADELRQMGTSFIAFSIDGAGAAYREATIVRQGKDRRLAGFVTFVNDGGSWKIDNM